MCTMTYIIVTMITLYMFEQGLYCIWTFSPAGLGVTSTPEFGTFSRTNKETKIYIYTHV